MKEIDVEYLDKAFPAGYVIAYTNPDGQIRLSYFNPHKFKQLFGVIHAIKEHCPDDKNANPWNEEARQVLGRLK